MISGMIINGCAASAVHSRQRLYRVRTLSSHSPMLCKNYYYYYPLHDSGLTLCHPPIIISMWGLNCPISCRVNFMQIMPYLPCSLPKYRQHYVHTVQSSAVARFMRSFSSCVSRVVAHFENFSVHCK